MRLDLDFSVPTMTSYRSLDVLVIAPDADRASSLGCLLEALPGLANHHVSHATNTNAAVEHLTRFGVDLVMMNLDLDGEQGADVVGQISAASDHSPLIVITQHNDPRRLAELTQAGAHDCIHPSELTGAVLKRAIDCVLARQDKHQAIQHQQRLLEELQSANKVLAHKNACLAQKFQTTLRFVDDVANEFHTPLTVIDEFSHVIEQGRSGPITDTQSRYLQQVTFATRDLAQLVDNLLDSNRLSAGLFKTNRRPCRVTQILRTVSSVVAIRAQARQIQIVEQIQPELDPVYADPDIVGQALINLAVHAIKSSPPHSQIRIWARENPDGGCTIGVTDGGSERSPCDVAWLTERFQRAGYVQQASTRGFGLALNVARELVWLNLGVIQTQDHSSCGNTLSFTLPAVDPPAILHRYMDRLAEVDPSPVKVTLLQVTPDDASAEIQELRQFVSSVSYPMDLTLQTVDDQSVLVVGSTAEPDRWIERLRSTRVSGLHRRLFEEESALDIRCLGLWSYPDERAEAISCIIRRLTGTRVCT